jgi:hypothetical protein
MPASNQPQCVAFDRDRLLASGPLEAVTLTARRALDAGASGPVLVFDDHSGRLVDLDLRPSGAPPAPGHGAAAVPAARGPGRPKLGVVAREVTLLPRHWDWLSAQPSGASATLRRLVEDARRAGDGTMRQRQAEEAVDRFMQAMTGNYVGHEEASRAFWRDERARFDALTAAWPNDVRDHLRRLANVVWTLRSAASGEGATAATRKSRG